MRDPRSTNRFPWAVITCRASLLVILAFAQVPVRAQVNANNGDRTMSQGDSRTPTAANLPRPISLNLKQFEIPFSIDSTGVRPVEVQLHVSRNQGAQWVLFASQPASGKNFLFTTQEDGLYWFATRTVDGTNKTDSAIPIQPQLIVNIDTENPLVEIKTDLRPDGKIVVSLVCNDQSPSVDSLRIDYAIDQSRQWNAVNDFSGQTDPVEPKRFYATAEFAPLESWQQISVRALVGDLAGNKTIVTATIDKPRIAATDFRLATAKSAASADTPATQSIPAEPTVLNAKAEEPRVAQLPTAYSPPVYATQPNTVPPMAGYPPTYPSITAPNPLQLNAPGQADPSAQSTSSPSTWAVPQFAVSSGAAPAVAPPESNNSPLPTSPSMVGPELSAPLPPGEPPSPTPATMVPDQPRPKTAAAAMRPLGESESAASDPRQSAARVSPNQDTPVDQGQPFNSSTQSYQAENNRVGEPIGDGLVSAGVQIRYSNSRKFSLEYEIESAGLAGVSDVELWGTRDRGLTWKRWGSDPDRESPFDIETNNDGAYGFRIVVVANNGLATPRPIENDLPDIFVVVDTISPSIRFTGAAYGEGNQTGALVMRYECTDLNLTQRPITLSFGPSQTGPWSTIAAGLENEGAYVWPADPNLPRQIYLRIDAIDLAGNLGSYILDTPIDIQGLAPRARIRGFNPLTGSPGGTRPVADNSTDRPSNERPQTATQPQARFK